MPPYPRGADPTAKQIQLLVEFADASLEYDIEVKAPMYARGGVGEPWIVDLDASSIVVYSHPPKGAYRRRAIYRSGDTVLTSRFPGIAFRVDDLLC